MKNIILKGILVFIIGFACPVSNAMELKSSAFQNNEVIPKLYTCDGKDISPPLNWSDVPEKTKSLALICDDPDAPGKIWVHWVGYNIDPSFKIFPANILPKATSENSFNQGINDFKKIGYGGPCPLNGIHRYFFKLYALDSKLNLDNGVTKEKLLKAMEGHILSEAELIGRYKR